MEDLKNVAVSTKFHNHVDDHRIHLPSEQFRIPENVKNEGEFFGSEMPDLIKAQIANHPLYPRLVSAYIECRKVGVPPEMASILEEIGRERRPIHVTGEIGADTELDDFMASYCDVLVRYKEELSKPFDEAKIFLSNIEAQLSNLCKEASSSTTTTKTQNEQSDEATLSTDEELSYAEFSEFEEITPCLGDEELKQVLVEKYSRNSISQGKELLKRGNRDKLPSDGRLTASQKRWNAHYIWPYPTDEENARLTEIGGLEKKQAKNPFTDQRKRRLKSSKEISFVVMEEMTEARSLSDLYFNTRTGDP